MFRKCPTYIGPSDTKELLRLFLRMRRRRCYSIEQIEEASQDSLIVCFETRKSHVSHDKLREALPFEEMTFLKTKLCHPDH